MSKELFKALEDMDWSDTPAPKKWILHYDTRGRITAVGPENTTESSDPFIEVDEAIGKEFISGARYKRSFYIKDKKLERKQFQPWRQDVSDTSLVKITDVDKIDEGTYFITVKGDPDLVIDSIVVDLSNKELQLVKLKEYLENNDCYKEV